MFLPHPRVKDSIVGSLRDRELACSASDRQGSNFESCVWRTVSSQSSHHPQEVLLAQFSLYVHKGGLKPDSFHFYLVLKTGTELPQEVLQTAVNEGRRVWKLIIKLQWKKTVKITISLIIFTSVKRSEKIKSSIIRQESISSIIIRTWITALVIM